MPQREIPQQLKRLYWDDLPELLNTNPIVRAVFRVAEQENWSERETLLFLVKTLAQVNEAHVAARLEQPIKLQLVRPLEQIELHLEI